ncbi:MAG: type II toxin-antitoxin system VapC family toxin [Candidatus Methylumidiphilus sp.]
MLYLLDTNIFIYLMKRRPPQVLERFRLLQTGDVVISAVTLAELRHGIERCEVGDKETAEHALRELLSLIPALPFDNLAAYSYGILAAAIRDRRRDALDRMIAAHAISLDVILVTNNTADFLDYPGLKLENWVESG